jgi:NAD(P)-dependent dehydrogenase (short-subunit alcohol dehydrogenase family)
VELAGNGRELTRPLDARVAIVTGSSRGIGKVLALKLAAEGANIVVCARSQEQGELPGTIGETARAVEAIGARALALKLDLAVDADIDAVIERTLAEFGRLDMLINNAVIVGPRRTLLGGDADFLDLAYRVNVRGPYRLIQKAAQVMAAHGGGTIVNITSGAARHPQAPVVAATPAELDSMDPSYGITKAALDRITTAYASELKAHNIAIVSVSPGLVITERIRQAAIRRNVDFGRAESPEVIAGAVARICRDGMQYTGRVLVARDLMAQ